MQPFCARQVMRAAASVGAVVTLCTLAHAQRSQAMGDDKLRAIESQVANVYSASATEADFTESGLNSIGTGPGRGHAVFTKGGFVLDYLTPSGRRVWSDLASTRVLDPTARHPVTTYVAAESPYASLLLLTGTARPSFRWGYEDGMSCFLSDAKFRPYRVDIVTSRIVEAQIDGQQRIVFTNIHTMATTAASAALAAGRIP